MIQRTKQDEGDKEIFRKNWKKDYRRGDMEVLYSRGDWHSWDEAINWLERYGEADKELTPGETLALKEDLNHLKEEGRPFVRDPEQAFRLAHKFRK